MDLSNQVETADPDPVIGDHKPPLITRTRTSSTFVVCDSGYVLVSFDFPFSCLSMVITVSKLFQCDVT